MLLTFHSNTSDNASKLEFRVCGCAEHRYDLNQSLSKLVNEMGENAKSHYERENLCPYPEIGDGNFNITHSHFID